ncbi:L-lactate dehydrogenase [Metamycoplasma subdolum]|uniref:L-lactate dehydrogenase n=1 Tax=Metamycoplasma subdolum TaxID=92407 RepID=A0A3M0A061_9BACT|nr:lactate dehydrogenase [Metamycoplasma subdolum]RMA78511.1 L-lactate dehydrogenase [Metamycoplasma subdolum]WPB50443.1 lactate dehydrogenase [Metamycoplasma subdolum]
MKKIGLIGVGAVGSSFLFALLNRNVEANYVIIDTFKDFAIAQAKDLNDAACAMQNNDSTFIVGTYEDLKDAEIVVITASVKPKEGKLQDRMELLQDNAKLLNEIGLSLKKVGFKGITIIASNPVDIMACVYQQTTGFDAKKVISSGTILETARLKKFVSQELDVKPSSIEGFVIGEHGRCCVVPFSTIKIGKNTIEELRKTKKLSEKFLSELGEKIRNEAFEIIKGKGITNFGIGSSLTEIAEAILNNKKVICSLGVQLSKEFKANGIYFGLPVAVCKDGYEYLKDLNFTSQERKEFDEYSMDIKKIVIEILDKIGQKHNLKI